MIGYPLVLERVAASADRLDDPERTGAQRAVELCRQLLDRPRESGKLVPQPSDLELRRELGRLAETLGRRSSRALPAAALARALLADLGGDPRVAAEACADCHAKLGMLGG